MGAGHSELEQPQTEFGWLDIGQVAEKATIMSAMKVKSEEKQEGLLELGWADHDYDNLSSSSIELNQCNNNQHHIITTTIVIIMIMMVMIMIMMAMKMVMMMRMTIMII